MGNSDQNEVVSGEVPGTSAELEAARRKYLEECEADRARADAEHQEDRAAAAENQAMQRELYAGAGALLQGFIAEQSERGKQRGEHAEFHKELDALELRRAGLEIRKLELEIAHLERSGGQTPGNFRLPPNR